MKFPLSLAGLLPGLALLSGCHPAEGKPGAQMQLQSRPGQPPAQISVQRTGVQSSTDPVSGLSWIQASELPRGGQQVYALIGSGGPFRYAKDGVTFGNREGLLPSEPRNYYREYTVPTPGASNRGTRRIICGGQPTTSRAECYYTADHYASFRRIRP